MHPIFPSQWKHRSNLQNQVAFTSVSPEFTSRFHVTFKQNLRQASNSVIKRNPSVIPSFRIIHHYCHHQIFNMSLTNSKNSSVFFLESTMTLIPPICCSLLGLAKEMVPLPGLTPNATAPPRPRRHEVFFRLGSLYRGNSPNLFPLPKNNASKKGGYVSTKFGGMVLMIHKIWQDLIYQVGIFFEYLRGFIHPNWRRLSSINPHFFTCNSYDLAC